MPYNFKNTDGTVELSIQSNFKDSASIQKGCPRPGATCSFKILLITNFSAGKTCTPEGIPLAPSAYLPLAINETIPIPNSEKEITTTTATIGITCVSEFDRLLEVCLTKLHTGDIAEATINCDRSMVSVSLTLELISISDSIELFELNSEQIFATGTLLKDQGVKLFTGGYILDAFFKFKQALKYLCLPHPSTRNPSHDSLISTIRNNLASCHLKLGHWESVIDLCSSVLETDPANIKALFRRGQSYIEIQEYEKANEDLLNANTLDPTNKAIQSKLAYLNEKEKALNAKYAQAMKKYFS